MIFLIDDDQDFLTSLRKRFELRGYDCAILGRLNELAKALSAAPAKAILVDFSCLKHFPAEESSDFWKTCVKEKVPVFVMTGHGPNFPGELDIKKNPAVKDVLYKPVPFDTLVKKLDKIGIHPKPKK